jgi:hypothetical protein
VKISSTNVIQLTRKISNPILSSRLVPGLGDEQSSLGIRLELHHVKSPNRQLSSRLFHLVPNSRMVLCVLGTRFLASKSRSAEPDALTMETTRSHG